jgi:hypothetical protein
MVTGKPIPGVAGKYNAKGQDCLLCGCNHLTWDEDEEYVECPHVCHQDINIESVFRPLTDYSTGLLSMISRMLKMKWDETARASVLLNQAWVDFEVWAASTPEGQLYKDTMDDMWWRTRNSMRKELEGVLDAKEWGVE